LSDEQEIDYRILYHAGKIFTFLEDKEAANNYQKKEKKEEAANHVFIFSKG